MPTLSHKCSTYYPLERLERLELSLLAWKAMVLPLDDSRLVRTGRLELPTYGFVARCTGPSCCVRMVEVSIPSDAPLVPTPRFSPRHFSTLPTLGTPPEIRTLTVQGLSLIPLPIGIEGHGCGGRIRTYGALVNSQLPYLLATPHW